LRHKGETHRTYGLTAGIPGETYEITPSGRLELLEYTVEDRSNPKAEGWERCIGAMTVVLTGGRRDMNYHGWLGLSCFGRAKFTDGTLVAFQPEQLQSIMSEEPVEVDQDSQGGEEMSAAEGDPVSTATMEMKCRPELAAVASMFRGPDLPSRDELDAFVDLFSPLMRSRLAWSLAKSLGLDANAIRQLLEDKSLENAAAEEWLRFEEGSD
jgi:hypothetical protein